MRTPEKLHPIAAKANLEETRRCHSASILCFFIPSLKEEKTLKILVIPIEIDIRILFVYNMFIRTFSRVIAVGICEFTDFSVIYFLVPSSVTHGFTV